MYKRQVLTSAGTGTPTWSTPSAGAMTLISTQTASSSASLSWTGLSGYDKYFLVFQNMIPASNGDLLSIVVGTGAVPTYITSGYEYGIISAGSSGSVSFYNATTSSHGIISSVIGIKNSAPGTSGNVQIMGMFSSNVFMHNGISNYINTSSTYYSDVCTGGVPANTTAKTAIKIYFVGGNMTSGTASLYGISS